MTYFNSKTTLLLWGLLFCLACAPDSEAEKNTTAAKSEAAAAQLEKPAEKPEPSIANTAKPEIEEVAEEEDKAKDPTAVKEEVKKEKVAEKKDAPKKKVAKKRPKIVFTSTTHDYGVIMQGDKVEYSYKFTNTGKADLLITNVSASCGCTQPSYPFIPIAPGEEGSIGVVFDSKGKLGRQKPTITVVTNARPTTYKLYLEGFVDAERAKEQPAPGKTPESETKKEEETGEGF